MKRRSPAIVTKPISSVRRPRKLEALRDLPAQTLDGVRIQLLGNIEFPHEVEQCEENGSRWHRPLSHRVPVPRTATSNPPKSSSSPPYSEVAVAMKDQPARDADGRLRRRMEFPIFPPPRTSAIRSSASVEASGWRFKHRPNAPYPAPCDPAGQRHRQHSHDVSIGQHI